MTTSEPTPEMVTFYERRTEEHIERVRRCLTLMASVTKYADELNERARVHDASKYGPEERIPYVGSLSFIGAAVLANGFHTLTEWKNVSDRQSITT